MIYLREIFRNNKLLEIIVKIFVKDIMGLIQINLKYINLN